jgi:murein L,D-transpeptidase YcbB/YkuD
LGDFAVKVVRFDRLLASTALGLVLVLSGQAVQAQQPQEAKGPDGQQVQIVVPRPDDTPPAAQKDLTGGVQAPAAQAAEPTKTAEPAKPAEPAAEPKMAEPTMVEPKAAEPKMAEPKTAEPAPEVTPVSATADSVVADKLRELITGKSLYRAVGRKDDRAGVEAFYKARDYKPMWVHDGAEDARAKSVIAYLGKAAEVGLDPRDYPTPDFAAAVTAEAVADAELKLTASALTFARHAQIGRVHFTRVAADISFKLDAPEPADVLTKLASADDAGKALDSYNPPMAEFKALREKLADLRAGKAEAAKVEEEKPAPLVRISGGPIMRAGMKDARVVLLRKRLQVTDNPDSPVYDQEVIDAVKAFQTQADLHVDGNVGPNTLAALNGEKREAHRPPADPIDTIIVNMERWRWYPRDLGNPHVIVNIPDYRLTLWNDDKVYWTTKIVAGKPSNATPLISAEMKFITVNPTWNVPPSIIEKEYLPALQQDPDVLDRIGLKIEQAPDGTVRIYQPPGAGNALGRIRFNFPNKFLVYQHDTPDKHLFKKDKRAYSHGCMRVENPLTYGEKLLSLALPKEHYTAARLEKMFGGSEININFPKNIWVHLTYQTAFVDGDGKLQFRDDVYGRDARMIAILKGSDRKVADIAIERPPNTSAKPVRAPIGMYGGNSYSSGPNFFELLFGGGRQYDQPIRPRRSVGPRYGRDGHIVTR